MSHFKTINFKLVAATFVPFLLLLFFQNCAPSYETTDSTGSSQNKFSGQSNGDGYGGKVNSYAHYDLTNTCSNQTVNIKDRIEIIDEEFYQTVKNCQTVNPIKIDKDEILLAEHNQDFVLKDKKLFESEEANGISEILCNGSGYDSQEQRFESADVFIRKVDGQLYGNIRYGIYKNGQLTKSKKIDNIAVMAAVNQKTGKTLSYNSLIPNPLDRDNYDFILDLSDDHKTATLHSIELKGMGLDLLNPPPPGEGPLPPNPGLPPEAPEDGPVIIENLNCIKH